LTVHINRNNFVAAQFIIHPHVKPCGMAVVICNQQVASSTPNHYTSGDVSEQTAAITNVTVPGCWSTVIWWPERWPAMCHRFHDMPSYQLGALWPIRDEHPSSLSTFIRLDWAKFNVPLHTFRSFRRRWGDCGISQNCSCSQSPQCVRCWVVCARPLLITMVCMCYRLKGTVSVCF